MTGRLWPAGAAVAVGFALLATLVVLRWRPLLGVDEWVAGEADTFGASHRSLVTITQALTTALGPRTWYGVAGIAALVCLWCRRFLVAALIPVVVVVGNGAQLWLGDAIGRPRPSVAVSLATAYGPSFPSGHALNAALVCGLCACLVSGRVVWVVATLLAGLVGATRVMLDVHYVADVVGGWLLAACLVVAFMAIVRTSSPGRAAPAAAPR